MEEGSERDDVLEKREIDHNAQAERDPSVFFAQNDDDGEEVVSPLEATTGLIQRGGSARARPKLSGDGSRSEQPHLSLPSDQSGGEPNASEKHRVHHFRISSARHHMRGASSGGGLLDQPSLVIFSGSATRRGHAVVGSHGADSLPNDRDVDAASQQSNAASSNNIELEIEHDVADDEEELATYKAKKYAQLNTLNRMAVLMVILLGCAFMVGVAALVSEQWYVYKIEQDYYSGSRNIGIATNTFAIFKTCFEGSCDNFDAGMIPFTTNFFPSMHQVPTGGNTTGTTQSPIDACRLSESAAHTRRDLAQTFAVIYVFGLFAATALSIAVNMRPTLERTQVVIACIALACLVGAAMPTYAVFGATYIQPKLLCGKGLCEYAMEAILPSDVSARRCSSGAVYGLWLFFGSNCACLVALLVNLNIVRILIHFKRETRRQMRNLRQYRVEAYLFRCLQDAEENQDREEMLRIKHMLGAVVGVKPDIATNPFGIFQNDASVSHRLRTPISTLAPRNDRVSFEDAELEDEVDMDTLTETSAGKQSRSHKLRLTRQQLLARAAQEGEHPQQMPIMKHMAGVGDWLYDSNSQLYYSYTLQAFWDPLCREYYDETTGGWVLEEVYLNRLQERRMREPGAEEESFTADYIP